MHDDIPRRWLRGEADGPMTVPPAYGDQDVEALYRDLLLLHAQAAEFRGLDLRAVPGYADFSVDSAIRAVAAAPEELVGVSARLAVMYDLAGVDTPGHDSFSDAFAVLADSTLALKPDHGSGFGPVDLIRTSAP